MEKFTLTEALISIAVLLRDEDSRTYIKKTLHYHISIVSCKLNAVISHLVIGLLYLARNALSMNKMDKK